MEQWDDHQWDMWEHKSMTICQNDLDRLVQLAEGFATGKRIDKSNNQDVLEFIASIKARIDPTPLGDL